MSENRREMVDLPEPVRAKLRERSFWHLATINQDGSPTVTPVWADVDDNQVIVNTAIGRLKERNARRDPRVALAMTDHDDPYSWVEIRGRVSEFVEGKRAEDSIDRLARKYLGVGRDEAGVPDDSRVLLVIEPTSVNFRTEPRPEGE